MAQYNPISKTQQAERRFNRPVSLHVASAWVIERLARRYAISVTHAAAVADLAGIGGGAAK